MWWPMYIRRPPFKNPEESFLTCGGWGAGGAAGCAQGILCLCAILVEFSPAILPFSLHCVENPCLNSPINHFGYSMRSYSVAFTSGHADTPSWQNVASGCVCRVITNILNKHGNLLVHVSKCGIF